MASAMLRSARSAISRAQFHRRSILPVESDPVGKLLPSAAGAGQSFSHLANPSPLNPRVAADASHFNARSEASKYSTTAVTDKTGNYGPLGGAATLRPLSPHLTIFKPQLDSTISISNRISGALLVSGILISYLLCIKVGAVCLSYPSFYQLFFYTSKYLATVGMEISTLALAFHLFYGIRHLVKH